MECASMNSNQGLVGRCTGHSLAVAALFLAFTAASCTSTISFEQDLPTEILELEALPVAVSDDLKSLTEFITKQGNPTTYEVGKLLSRLFDGDGQQAALGKINSHLDVSSYSDGLLFSRWEATYRLNLSVQIPGNRYVISGVGIGKWGDTFTAARSASKEAIQNCALDVYEQVKAILNSPAKPTTGP